MEVGVLGWEPCLRGAREWVGGWVNPTGSSHHRRRQRVDRTPGCQPREELRTSQGIPTSNALGNAHAEFN